MKTAIYPGTFDPVTKGHLDILERAIAIFDKVIVTLGINPNKKPLFTAEERMELLKDAVKDYKNVEIAVFDGLLVEFARKNSAVAIIRGLRALSDFEYEFQMALMNKKLADEIHTVFLMPNEKYTYLNSSIVRNLAQFGTDVTDFVTPLVNERLKEKFLTGNTH